MFTSINSRKQLQASLENQSDNAWCEQNKLKKTRKNRLTISHVSTYRNNVMKIVAPIINNGIWWPWCFMGEDRGMP